MSAKSPISNLRIIPVAREGTVIDIRPGSINIKWRPLTIAEQMASLKRQRRFRFTSPTPPCIKG
ncbi:MAG: hypothetical protein OXF44_00460 [Anaerolineaceae bacterium]|nr:hypothetical protein [Anaerolineaceae bacterium]